MTDEVFVVTAGRTATLKKASPLGLDALSRSCSATSTLAILLARTNTEGPGNLGLQSALDDLLESPGRAAGSDLQPPFGEDGMEDALPLTQLLADRRFSEDLSGYAQV